MSKDFPTELMIPFNAPLQSEDTLSQTYGCRHSNPDICGSCYLDGICAFVNPDKICHKPSKKWAKQYELLGGKK